MALNSYTSSSPLRFFDRFCGNTAPIFTVDELKLMHMSYFIRMIEQTGHAMIKTKNLIVDDEPQIQGLLTVDLKGYGYGVTVARNGREVLIFVERQQTKIIVLDIDLGSTPNGLKVCAEIRRWATTPIIMITVNNYKKTRLPALNAEADDYILKPFDMEELEARIRAIMRWSAVNVANSVSSEIRVHDLVLDWLKRRVTLKGEEIHLAPTEYKLLSELATHPGELLTFEVLMQKLHGAAESTEPKHYIQVYINTLRKKLQDNPVTTMTKPLYIFKPYIDYPFTDIDSRN